MDHDRRIVSFTLSGRLDTTDMLSVVNKAFGERKPGIVYDVLSDNRDLDEPATPDQIKMLVGELIQLGTVDGMRAAVVVATDASYGMMRLMSAYTEPLGIQVGIFRDLAEAQAFVDARASA